MTDSVLSKIKSSLAAPTAANAYLFLVITNSAWAGNFVVGRAVAGHVPPMTLAFLRWTGASLLILAVAWGALVRDWPAIRKHLGLLVLLGILGSGTFNTLQYIALVDTTATNAAVINSSGPVLIAIAAFLFNSERIALPQALGILVSLAGVLIVMTRGEPWNVLALKLNRGDLVMFTAMITWALYTAMLRRRPPISGLSLAAVTYLVAAVLNAPLSAWELANGAHMETGLAAIAAIVYTAVFPSFLAYLCFNRGVEIIGGTRAGVFLHLVPLIGSLLAFAFLGEQPRPYHAIGFAAIVAGVLLAARGK